MGGLICIAIPYFTKIGQTIAEISHLTIFKMMTVRHLGFLKVWVSDKLVSSGGLICAILQNFVKIGQTFSDISQFFLFSRWPSSAILDLEILKFLVDGHIERPNMHRRTTFHQNRPNGCWDIAFNNFQNGGRPPSCIFKVWCFWSARKLWKTNMCHHAKFCRNRLNGFWYIAIFPCDAMLSTVYAVVMCLSVCLCVCVCVCHTPVLYQNGWTYDHANNATR